LSAGGAVVETTGKAKEAALTVLLAAVKLLGSCRLFICVAKGSRMVAAGDSVTATGV